MARWNVWCAVVLIGSVWAAPIASAAKDQEPLSAEGTITSVDLNRPEPTITFRLSTGKTLTLLLGRIGALESFPVGATAKFRYTSLKGVETLESIGVTAPVQPAAAASPAATPSSAASPSKPKKSEDSEDDKQTQKEDGKKTKK